MQGFNDSIYEQLIKIQPTKRDWLLTAGIWVAAFILVYGAVLTAFRTPALLGLMLMAIILIFWGAVKLAARLNIEYEAIIVNNEMDIDKIIAKSSRKRMITVKLNGVEELGSFNSQTAARLNGKRFDFKLICSNPAAEALYIIYRHPKKGLCLVVLEKSERLEAELLRSVPRTVVNK